MDAIYKILENCEVKKVGERQYEFTASTADMDRDGEVIDVSGWDLKNFKKNPVILFAHDYRTLPIGKATKIGVKDGKLMDVVEFPPEGTYEFADTVARLVDAGYIKTQSVGFIPKKWEDGDWTDEDGKGSKPRRTYTKQELLEISIVPVPSNPNALMNAVNEGVITMKQFNSISKPEVTEDYIRIPISEGHDDHKIRTINISADDGIKALYCVDCKENITYLFLKEKGWTMAKAKQWVKEHEKKAVEHSISQAEIKDEIDYLGVMIGENGLSYDNQIELKRIIDGVTKELIIADAERITGDDTPVKNNKESLELLNKIIKEQMEVK
jgi:HK97 family phage prohead protease